MNAGRGVHKRAAAAAKSLQSCPTLCDPIDGSPPGSPIPGILQARTLEWVAISFSNHKRANALLSILSSNERQKKRKVTPQLDCCYLVAKSHPTLLRSHGYRSRQGKNTGVGCHFLLQGIFLTWGSNLCLLLGRQILYH